MIAATGGHIRRNAHSAEKAFAQLAWRLSGTSINEAEWPDAQTIHGITPVDVANAPSLENMRPRLVAATEDAEALAIYNAEFDLTFIPDSVRPLASAKAKALCAMEAFSLHAGDWSERW